MLKLLILPCPAGRDRERADPGRGGAAGEGAKVGRGPGGAGRGGARRDGGESEPGSAGYALLLLGRIHESCAVQHTLLTTLAQSLGLTRNCC